MSNINKQICLMDYDVIAFDLDFTIIRYNISESTTMIFNSLRQYLVEKKSYPRCLLDVKIDKDFMQKGLLLDAEKGNILKISADGTILRGTHGTTMLSQQQIISIYGENKKWDLSMQFLENPLSTWNGPSSTKLRMLLDYFDFSTGLLFAQLIDLIDAQKQAKHEPLPKIYSAYADILEGLEEQYNPKGFSNGKSSYFKKIRDEPERYLLRTSSTVVNWLKKLRDAKKFIVLITGSHADFANLTATYAIGENWQSLFDCIIYNAKKPGFFFQQRPFFFVESMEVVHDSQLNLLSNVELNREYSGGNWGQLLRTLALRAEKPEAELRTVHIGDNLFLDVYMPVKHSGMDAIAIAEELLAELNQNELDTNEYREYILSKFWGSYFKVDNCSTFWMQIISFYSQICIPSLEYLAKQPITHTFKSDGCFYPIVPSI